MSGATDSTADLPTGQDPLRSAPRSRFNASLVGEPLRQVEEIAEAEGVAPGEVIRRAIKLAHYMHQEQAAGTVFKRHAADGRVDRITVNYRGRKRLRSV
jgi:hypothetical protein